jgi:hypothetical protein
MQTTVVDLTFVQSPAPVMPQNVMQGSSLDESKEEPVEGSIWETCLPAVMSDPSVRCIKNPVTARKFFIAVL